MSILKSVSLLTIASFARMGGALVSFSITARALGVSGYGQLMVWMSVASIVALATNFGLSTYVLREAGAARDRSTEIIADAVGARLIVVALGVVCSVIGLYWVPPQHRWTFLFLLGASLAEGLTELFNAGFRARNNYSEETRLSIHAAWIYPLAVGGVAWATASVTLIAFAYFLSRFAITALTVSRLTQLAGSVVPRSTKSSLKCVGSSVSYAAESGLTGLFGQVDSVVLNHYLGHAAVGLHQAGMRLYLAGSSFATVLNNVFLPRAAAAHATSATHFRHESRALQLTFLASGAVLGFGLALIGPYVIPVLFGSSFQSASPLMPWFGLMFIVRFASSAWSVSFTAQGQQWLRAGLTGCHWLLIVCVAAWSVPHYGNPGWLFAVIVGNLFLVAAYAAKSFQQHSGDRLVLACSMGVMLLYLPILLVRVPTVS